MPTLDYKIAASALVGYGLVLLYLYQIGFFSIVGFEFAGLIGALDIWATLRFVFAFVAGITAAILLLGTSKNSSFYGPVRVCCLTA